MYVTYWPTLPGAAVAELRGGVWSELTPPGWENTVNEAAGAWLRVTDAQGKLVLSAALTDAAGQTVDMGHWPAGMYWFTVLQGEGFSTVKVLRP